MGSDLRSIQLSILAAQWMPSADAWGKSTKNKLLLNLLLETYFDPTY